MVPYDSSFCLALLHIFWGIWLRGYLSSMKDASKQLLHSESSASPRPSCAHPHPLSDPYTTNVHLLFSLMRFCTVCHLPLCCFLITGDSLASSLVFLSSCIDLEHFLFLCWRLSSCLSYPSLPKGHASASGWKGVDSHRCSVGRHIGGEVSAV